MSIFAQNFKRKQLKDLIPGLIDFRIKEAKKHCKEHGPGTAVPTAPVHRFFLGEDKVDHFLRVITSDMISQDTAYGTSKMKLESGVELVIPKPIRKLIPARIIAQYLTICDESGFKPASTRTLFRILEVCPASTRKSLQDLDNYTADGSEAFKNLEEIISKLYDGGMPNSKAHRLRSMALSCKRYLKRGYSTHVVNDSTSDVSSASPDYWARFLPLHFKEKSAEFYGTRGINWHVTAVIRKTPESSLSVEVFVHVFDNCDQDQIAVASITQNTLSTLKKLYPELTGVYFKPDNAGYYHGGYLLTSLPSIGHETGIRVIGYDFEFSEAQHGKDICDRKTATMKQHARRFVAETKTDILTACDLKKALESNGERCRNATEIQPNRPLALRRHVTNASFKQ